MNSYKAFLFLILIACISLESCSGLPKGSTGGGGTANVSFVLVSDTPPATLGLVSFKVTATSITLTPSAGTPTTFSLNSGNGFSFDLVRLQSDSGFVGTVPKVATGTYSSVTVNFAGATLAFFNGTGAAITNLNPQCDVNTVCVATFAGPFASTITAAQTINGDMGFGIDVKLANALTLSGTTLTMNLANSGNTPVTTTFTLPGTNSNLAVGQLALIEDITGAVSIANTSVTITPAQLMSSFPITASTNSSTNYDPDPTNTLCPVGTTQLASCVAGNQAASMDAILKSDGTFTIQEIEPLLASPIVDTVEGTVVSISPNNLTQFGLITTNLIPAATNSLISSLSVGAPLTVNLPNNPNPFLIDSKGLPVASQFPAIYGNFANAINTEAIHLGQTVAVQVTAFTPANGNIVASSTANTVTLRWTRFTASTAIATPGAFTINSLPGDFGFNQGLTFQVQSFTGTQGTHGVTNLDGFQGDTSNLKVGSPVAVRALFIENPGNTLNPAFFAAKVRQH